VLKYDKTTQMDSYPSFNFGQCKGLTFNRVLIYPNNPLRDFIGGKPLKSPQKYYVAVTRPKYSLAIVFNKFPDNNNCHKEMLKLGEKTITVMRLIVENV